MDLKGINNQHEQLASAMEQPVPNNMLMIKGKRVSLPSPILFMRHEQELQQTIEHIKGMHAEKR